MALQRVRELVQDQPVAAVCHPRAAPAAGRDALGGRFCTREGCRSPPPFHLPHPPHRVVGDTSLASTASALHPKVVLLHIHLPACHAHGPASSGPPPQSNTGLAVELHRVLQPGNHHLLTRQDVLRALFVSLRGPRHRVLEVALSLLSSAALGANNVTLRHATTVATGLARCRACTLPRQRQQDHEPHEQRPANHAHCHPPGLFS
ncbi:hypothetical protein T484DRAFT_2255885, partial [Baffinella frigidus]